MDTPAIAAVDNSVSGQLALRLTGVNNAHTYEMQIKSGAGGWTPAGMVQHMALDDERYWFRDVFAGQSVELDDDPANAWDVAPGGGRAAVERYREECEPANEIIAPHSPVDEPAAWPERWGSWRLSNLYQLTLHVITETSCHAGHLDIAREFIDGTQHTVVN